MPDISRELERLANLVKNNRESIEIKSTQNLPFEVGGEYFIRTVTYHLTGRVKDIVGKFLILEDAAWIGDSGRFHKFFNKPTDDLEVEPFGERDVFVNTDSITDATRRSVLLEVK